MPGTRLDGAIISDLYAKVDENTHYISTIDFTGNIMRRVSYFRCQKTWQVPSLSIDSAINGRVVHLILMTSTIDRLLIDLRYFSNQIDVENR